MAVDWTKVEQDYICSTATVRELAKKYGVSYQSVSHHCHREGWQEKRQALSQKTTERVAEEVCKQNIGSSVDTLKVIADGMDAEINRILDELAFPGLPAVSRSYLIRSLEIAYKLAKDSKGILSASESLKLDVARAELQLKQAEAKRIAEEVETGKEPITIVIADEIKEYSK